MTILTFPAELLKWSLILERIKCQNLVFLSPLQVKIYCRTKFLLLYLQLQAYFLQQELKIILLITILENEEDRMYFKSLLIENPMVKEAEVEAHKNQFHSTERGTQTKMVKYNDESLQTDPLPV